MLSVRGEFGYWVFEGDRQPAQRPSWNYRKEDGGGIILDMLCHWRYVLDNLFGEVKSVSCLGATHIPKRWDEAGKPYAGDRRRRRLRDLRARRRRGKSRRSTARGRCACAATTSSPSRSTARTARRSPACTAAAAQPRVATPKPVWNPDVPQTDRLLRQLAGGARRQRLRQRLQGRSGSCSSATWSTTRRSVDAASRAPRACSSSRRRCRAGRSGAGSTCRLGCRCCVSARMSRDHASPAPTARSRTYTLRAATPWSRRRAAAPRFNRIAYAAAHVVADPLARADPWLDAAIDWDATIAYRRHLWSLGLGVAEAMDTAQRGMGLDWPTSLELIRRSLDAARDMPGALVASRRRHRPPRPPDAPHGRRRRSAPTRSRCAAIEALGGRIILMASRALARVRAVAGRLRARLRPRARAGRSSR